MFDYKKAKKPTSFGQSYCFTMRDINPSTMDSFNLCMEVIEWCTERFEKPSPSSTTSRNTITATSHHARRPCHASPMSVEKMKMPTMVMKSAAKVAMISLHGLLVLGRRSPQPLELRK